MTTMRRMRKNIDARLHWLIPALCALTAGCIEGENKGHDTFDESPMGASRSPVDDLRDDPAGVVALARREKDHFFRGPDSPLKKGRGTFVGLRYYPYDPAYRVVGTFEPHDPPEEQTLGTSTGTSRPMLMIGTIRFTIDSVEETLNTYVSAVEERRLFIPFRDRTSGGATYGAGRYLEVMTDELPGTQTDILLDFNEAFNPFCAYNEEYSCPLVPNDNILEIAIPAGEQTYT